MYVQERRVRVAESEFQSLVDLNGEGTFIAQCGL